MKFVEKTDGSQHHPGAEIVRRVDEKIQISEFELQFLGTVFEVDFRVEVDPVRQFGVNAQDKAVVVKLAISRSIGGQIEMQLAVAVDGNPAFTAAPTLLSHIVQLIR